MAEFKIILIIYNLNQNYCASMNSLPTEKKKNKISKQKLSNHPRNSTNSFIFSLFRSMCKENTLTPAQNNCFTSS